MTVSRMHSIRIHKVISQVINIYYYIGFWHQGDKPTARELRTKIFYYIYHSVFLVSSVAGAITHEKLDKKVFSAEVSIAFAVLNVKLGFLMWKQDQILNLLNRICVVAIKHDDDIAFFNGKMRGFIKFVATFLTVGIIGCSEIITLPFLCDKKQIFFEIGFPWDYQNSEIAFWTAHVFSSTTLVISIFITPFTVITWYLLLCCSLRYDILGRNLQNMGRLNVEIKVSDKQKHNYYTKDLKECVDVHIQARELTDELGTFLADIFLIQFGTSGLCICGSIYCLAFDVGDNLFERCLHLIVLFYCTSDLFLITYYGNEIMLSSDRLSYSLFESEWTEQPQATKKCVVVFGEYLKQPHVLIIGRLYPLTLETFTRILNSAYSMFNILKSFK